MELVVAIIGAVATILSAILPGILERSANEESQANSSAAFSKGKSLAALTATVVFFSVAQSNCEDSISRYCSSCSPMSMFFFLGLGGVAASLLGRAASQIESGSGVLAGYGSAVFAVLLIFFWLITDWTRRNGMESNNLIVGNASCDLQRFHLITLFVLSIITLLGILRHKNAA